MNLERYIADRITTAGSSNAISRPIVKIGIIGIALGISVMILTISIVFGFKSEIIHKITGFTSHVTIKNPNINPSDEPDPIKISADSLRMLKELPFVKHIQMTALKNGIIKTKEENEGIYLKGVSADYDFSFLKKYLVQGTLPVYSDTAVGKQMLISQKLADRLDIKLGQKVLVYFITRKKITDSITGEAKYEGYEKRARDYKVCGVFNTGFSEFDSKLAYVDINQIRRLNYWQNGEAGNYELFVDDFSKLDAYTESLEDLVGYNYSVSSVKSLHSNIFSWLEMVDVNGIIIVSLMIIVAGVNMITALLILILERANMVGLVKSIGMSNASVRKIFFYVSLRLLGRGLLYGNLIGIGLVLLQLYAKPVKLDSETYYVDAVPVIFNIVYIAVLNAGIILSCLLMMFFPTLILTKLTPIKTLRFD
ncbi:MAG: ABC transporter permease [Bacteroidia bacterium]